MIFFFSFSFRYLCFRLVLLHSVSYVFFLYRSTSLSLCMVFKDEVPLIYPSANVLSLKTLTSIIRTV